ncbi:hypothetical protein [Bacteroidetes bacterium endosymbiont of Geopemphigus sp.]|uniref:hypothetical protein n=1 Tax=Bacteroidetes bacterium endosymbiont of Geopemphigus sp. TaxID=2047937 RepID=UPI000CD1AC90|nr:hypothetical protein [Bacteroidetes bacterium endosymbiont of Geopemphigus sp.]
MSPPFYEATQKVRQKIYVLDQSSHLLLTLEQDINQNRSVEARDHVRRFHELFLLYLPIAK